jgi:hypothetical protein
MRGGCAWGIAALALGLGSALLPQLAVDGRSDAREPTHAAPQWADCRVGGAPTHDYGQRPPEEFLRYGTRPVVIGCATLASGRRLELVGYQQGRGERRSLCIDHYDFDSGVSWGCGSNLVSDGGAIDATSKTGLPARPDVVSGTLSASVARVVVRSEIAGSLRRHPVVVVRARGRKLLRAIAVRKPFGRYVAEVPRGARAATAEALDARGRSLRLAFFPGFRGAVGQGRACYACRCHRRGGAAQPALRQGSTVAPLGPQDPRRAGPVVRALSGPSTLRLHRREASPGILPGWAPTRLRIRLADETAACSAVPSARSTALTSGASGSRA